MESFEFEQQVLFKVVIGSVTSHHWVQCPRVGLEVNLNLYALSAEAFIEMALSYLACWQVFISLEANLGQGLPRGFLVYPIPLF